MTIDTAAIDRAALLPRSGSPRRREAHGRRRIVVRGLIAADAVGLLAAFVATAVLWGPGAGADNRLALAFEYLLFAFTLPGWVLAAKLHALYDRDEERTDHSTIEDFVGVLHVITLGVWALYVGAHLTGLADPELYKAVTFWALAIAFVTGSRAAARSVCRRHPSYPQATIVVGADEVGQLVARKFLQHKEYGIRLLGFVDDARPALREDLGDTRILGGVEQLEQLIERLAVDRVVVAFSSEAMERQVDLVGRLTSLDVQIDIVPRFYEVVGAKADLHSVEGLPLVGLPSPKLLPFSRTIKRAFDVVGAGLLLTLTAPVFAVAAWCVRRDSPGPVFFRQRRLGLGMQEFTALKFRTMRIDTDDAEHRDFIRRTMDPTALPAANGIYKLDRSSAVTPSGRWLRTTSLDELPQLLNVLRGEMSLVGPRPCLDWETEHFRPHHFERFNVPAGITGLWQVTARAHSTFGEALDLDVSYARNWSLGLDLLLLLKTPFELLRQRNATS